MDDETMKESAKALQAIAPVAGKGIDALTRTGAYVTEVLGKVPHDTVGLFGDYLHEVRLRKAAKLRQETSKILKERKIDEPKIIPPAIAVPLIEAAVDAPDELQTLWARLLANALDPSRGGVRQSFIDALKKFDPPDALVLQAMQTQNQVDFHPLRMGTVSLAQVSLTEDEKVVSLQHLVDLRCLELLSINTAMSVLKITSFGRQLLRACAQ